MTRKARIREMLQHLSLRPPHDGEHARHRVVELSSEMRAIEALAQEQAAM